MLLSLLGCAVLLGLLLGQTQRFDPLELGVVAAIGTLAAVLARAHLRWRLIALASCAAALAAVRATLAAPSPSAPADVLPAYSGLAVTLRGTVTDPPSVSERSARVLLQAEAVAPQGEAQRQTTRARVALLGRPDGALGQLSPGQVVEVDGTLLAPVGRAPPTLAWPSRIRLAGSGQLDPAASLRARARVAIEQGLSQPQAALAADVLLGGSGGLDPELRLHLQRSGLAHLVAIDGFKQALLAGGLRALTVPLLGSRRATLLVLPAVVSYALLSGARPSAVRAAVMLGLAEGGRLTGRVADPLSGLVLAVALMAAVEPSILFDVGLQLSASATLGLILLWPRLRRGMRRVPRCLAEPVGLTLAVSLATLPVTLSAFQQVSLVSPLAHVLAVPLVPLVMAGAALLALVGPLAPGSGLAAGAAVLAGLPATLLVEVVRLLGSLPGAAMETGSLAPPAALAMALGLTAWGLWQLPEAAGLRRRSQVFHAPAAIAAVSLLTLWLAHLTRPDGQLHMRVLAQSGTGEAVFVRGPTGQTALVVTGRLDGFALLSELQAVLPVWEHAVDVVVVLEPRAQPGLELLLKRYPARRVVDADAEVDLGRGAALEVDTSLHAATLRFGDIALPVPGAQPDETEEELSLSGQP